MPPAVPIYQEVELQSTLPILPLFELDQPGGKAEARTTVAADGAPCGGRKDGVALLQCRLDAGGQAVHSTPEEQSVRTGQDMGTPEMPTDSVAAPHQHCS